MTEQTETALLAWGRTADGECQLFTGKDIYNRVGRWETDRLRRDIPVISTCYCRMGRLYYTAAIALVPERAVPLNRPDETDTLGNWVLLAYKRAEDD